MDKGKIKERGPTSTSVKSSDPHHELQKRAYQSKEERKKRNEGYLHVKHY